MPLELLKLIWWNRAQAGFRFEIIFERAGRMDGVELSRGITPGQLQDDTGATGMLGEELGYIVDFAMENDPAAFLGGVFCNCVAVSVVFLMTTLPWHDPW
jgi:hypothetical protein